MYDFGEYVMAIVMAFIGLMALAFTVGLCLIIYAAASCYRSGDPASIDCYMVSGSRHDINFRDRSK